MASASRPQLPVQPPIGPSNSTAAGSVGNVPAGIPLQQLGPQVAPAPHSAQQGQPVNAPVQRPAQVAVAQPAAHQGPLANGSANPPPQPGGGASVIGQNNASLPPDHPGWRSTWLRWPALSVMTGLTIGFMATIIGLLVRSKTNKVEGLATVSLNDNHKLFNNPALKIGVGLSWTAVPVLIVSLYALALASVVNAAAVRQPYVELRSLHASSAGALVGNSILLDYTSELTICRPITACKRKHFSLAYSFFLLGLVQIFLAAITAHLFFTQVVAAGIPVSMEQVSTFHPYGFGARSDLTPIFDIGAATRIYGGRPLPWTTLTESFLPVSLDAIGSTPNLTFEAEAYSATLDCRALSAPYEFALNHTSTGWKISTADRGCGLRDVTFEVETYTGVLAYIQTYSVPCSRAQGQSRIIVVAALSADPSAPNSNPGNPTYPDMINKTAVSCISSYFQRSGQLSLSIDATRPEDPTVNSFSASSGGLLDPRPVFVSSFETQINQGGVVDETGTVHGNTFGVLLYQYARKMAGYSYFTGDVLKTAIEDMYTSVFAIMTTNFLVKDVQSSESVQGTSYVSETRLVVVLPIACAMVAILALVVVMLAWIWIYASLHKSVQYEDSAGLLSIAALLRGSDLLTKADDLSDNAAEGKVVARFIQERKADPLAHREKWTVKDWESPRSARLVSY